MTLLQTLSKVFTDQKKHDDRFHEEQELIEAGESPTLGPKKNPTSTIDGREQVIEGMSLSAARRWRKLLTARNFFMVAVPFSVIYMVWTIAAEFGAKRCPPYNDHTGTSSQITIQR